MATTFFEELKLEGRMEGRMEGRTEDRVEVIVELLQDNIGSVPKTIREKIETCTDMAKLRELTRLAASCDSLDEFRKALK